MSWIIDDDMQDTLGKYAWQQIKGGYWLRMSKTSAGRKGLLLHREVWRIKMGTDVEEINHINGDPNDNRICNLEAATRQLNNLDRRYKKRDLPTGVTQKSKNCFKAKLSGKTIGYYKTPEEAGQAYTKAKEEKLACLRHK